MNYDDFICFVQKEVQQKVGKEVRVQLHQVPKNNGILLDGLTIVEENCKISPTIYLNDFYREYEDGKTGEEIAEEILEIYQESKVAVSVDTSFYRDFQKVKDQIVCKLINYEKNRELLDRIPYVPYLDLAIVFYYRLEHKEIGSGTIQIYDSHLEMWQISKEELYRIARKNTENLMPYAFYSMFDVMQEIMGQDEAGEECGDEPFPMYVLTNQEKNLGAVEMVFDHILNQIGEKLQEDYYILPSSIHEVIIVPASAAPARKELEEMVQDINASQVLPQEVLSDHVYYYQCRIHSLEM